MLLSLRACFLLVALALAAGCAKSSDHEKSAASGHAHVAPHGGALVPLGDHGANLEFVRDAAAGKLTVYVLDAHAANFVRIKAPSFALLVTSGAEKHPLLLQAVANPATGETVGDSAQFEARDAWLKTAAALDGTVSAIEVAGQKFENVSFHLPATAGQP